MKEKMKETSILDKCVICQSNDISFWNQKKYQYSKNINDVTFDIFKCNSCSSAFLNPLPSDELLTSIYAFSGHGLSEAITLKEVLYREMLFPNSSIDAKRMAASVTYFDESLAVEGNKKKALDIGSGYGFASKELLENGYNVISINPGEYENDVFFEMNNYYPINCYLEEFDTNDKFGVVYLSQVLEHLKYPVKAVNKINNLLSEKGSFVIAVPNFNSLSVKVLGIKENSCLWIPEHVNYFTKNGLTKILEDNGFEVKKVEYISKIPSDAIVKRLKFSNRFINQLIEGFTKLSSSLCCPVLNFLGVGLYINIYAQKITK